MIYLGRTMHLNYTIDLKDEHDNILWPDVDCMVETSVTFDPINPVVSIDAISIIGFNTKTNEKSEIDLRFSRLPIWRILEGHIAEVLSKNDEFYDYALKEQGISYRHSGKKGSFGCYIEKVS